MYKFWTILLTILILQAYSQLTNPCKVTIIQDKNNPNNLNQKLSSFSITIDIYPTVYSSPVNNLNNQIFTIYKSNPIDACSFIKMPNIDQQSKVGSYPYLIVIDRQIGACGDRRRIQMVKDAGAKGIVMLTTELSNAISPYGDFSDNTFLVFVADANTAKSKLLPQQYMLATVTTTADQINKVQIQFWISTLSPQSYQLLSYWQKASKQIPKLSTKVDWRPRYALWGCNSGLYTPNKACENNPQYLSSCACKGQFCSPQTNYKAADAIVKQDIRQKLIFKNHKDKYLQYIKGFRENCFSNFQEHFVSEDCANSQMVKLNIDYNEIDSKVEKFMSTCSGDIYQELTLDRNRFSQLEAYPAALLNRQPIKFKSKKEFQTQLCKKLSLQKQEGCVNISKFSRMTEITIHALFFILIVGGLIAIVMILLMLYRKSIRKDMQKQMKMQVSASVEHYFALTQTK